MERGRSRDRSAGQPDNREKKPKFYTVAAGSQAYTAPYGSRECHAFGGPLGENITIVQVGTPRVVGGVVSIFGREVNTDPADQTVKTAHWYALRGQDKKGFR